MGYIYGSLLMAYPQDPENHEAVKAANASSSRPDRSGAILDELSRRIVELGENQVFFRL